MKHIKLYLLVVAFSGGYIASAQNELLNHKKYYYYKSRVHNDFGKVGASAPPNDKGASFIFNERDPVDTKQVTFYTNLNPNPRLHIGDGTVRLGIYLSALATEYRLLKNNGQDVARVKHEIFCALNAINRVDYYAEDIIGNSTHALNPHTTSGPSLNGFFVRDDVPANFVSSNYNHFNYYHEGLTSSNHKGFTQTYPHPVNFTTSNLGSFLNPIGSAVNNWNDQSTSQPGVLHGFEESQDQVFYIMMACALVKEMLNPNETDNNAVFGYGAGGSDLRQQAIDISDRVLKHISNDPTYSIRNPANSNLLVNIGGLALPASYALDNAGCFIKYNGVNNDYSSNDMVNYIMGPLNALNMPFTSCTDYRNTTSQTSGGIWNANANSNFGSGVNNSDIFQVLSSVCNCIYENVLMKDLDVQAQIDELNVALEEAEQDLEQALSNLPPWLQETITFLIDNFQTFSNHVGGLLVNLQNSLMPVGNINSTDYRLAYCSNSATFVYDDCYSNQAVKTGGDFIFPVYVRDLLHANNSNSGLPAYLQLINFNNTPGHLQLKNQLLTILDDAPCYGNEYKWPNYPTNNWGVSNRCDLQHGLWRIDCNTQGEYAGTDYMLLHNLYYLREGYNTGPIDYSFRNVTASLPIGNNFTSSNKRTLGAFEQITASNVVNSNGAADYRAGKEIALLDGFSAVLNSDFGAYIGAFSGTCNNDDMYRSAGTQPKNDDFYEDATSYESQVKSNPYVKEKTKSDYVQSGLTDDIKHQLDSVRKSFTTNVARALNKIEVYPNPNSGEFNIQFNLEKEDNVEVTISNVLGETVYTYKHVTGYFTLPVSLSHLSKGVYTVKFREDNNVIGVKKITIQ